MESVKQDTFDFDNKPREPLKNLPGDKYYNGLNAKVLDYITKLTLGRFYGELRLTFEGGKVIHGKTIKSFKPGA